jgi:site-specific DNA-methyltransferase (adenine-specific)
VKPYYQDESATIYHGDCRNVIDELWEGIRAQPFDLLLTDPPYGVLSETGSAATRRSGGNENDGRMQWDVAPDSSLLASVRRLAPLQMIWGGCHLALPATVGYLVWDKQIDGLNFGEVEYCWTSMKFAPRVFRYRAVGVDGGKVHPTQKPEALMIWCLSFAAKAETIVDPFCGSGTTLVAAKRLGRIGIGIEREEKYCEIAAKRLAQGSLFTEISA